MSSNYSPVINNKTKAGWHMWSNLKITHAINYHGSLVKFKFKESCKSMVLSHIFSNLVCTVTVRIQRLSQFWAQWMEVLHICCYLTQTISVSTSTTASCCLTLIKPGHSGLVSTQLMTVFTEWMSPGIKLDISDQLELSFNNIVDFEVAKDK